MPLTADERKRVIQAQALMQRGEYDRAKQLLQGIDQRSAQAMISRLNDNQTDKYRYSAPVTSYQYQEPPQPVGYYQNNPSSNVVINNNIIAAEPQSRSNLAFQIVLVNLLVWVCSLTMFAPTMGANPIGVFLIAALLAGIYLVFQWLAWRFYWIFLALAWTFATFLLLMTIAAVTTNPALLTIPR